MILHYAPVRFDDKYEPDCDINMRAAVKRMRSGDFGVRIRNHMARSHEQR